EPVDAHLEPLHLSAQHEDAVEDGRGEGVDVAGDIGQPGGAAKHTPQVVARGFALRSADEQEVQRDRIQQHARARATAVTGDVADQPDGEPAATLGPLLPVRAHAVVPVSATTSPVASTSSPRSTRKRQRGAPPSSSTRATSPGSSGCRNFTCGNRRPAGSAPSRASIASMTRSSTTTPGTSGRPGKCPGRLG